MELSLSGNPLTEAEGGGILGDVFAEGFEGGFFFPCPLPSSPRALALPFLSQMASACGRVVSTAHTAGIPLESQCQLTCRTIREE